MAYFPLFLNLRNKQVLIIGESEAAFQELSRFLAFEANVTILTESVEQNLLLMSQAYPDQVRVVEKEVSMENISLLDCAPTLVVCVTGDPKINTEIYAYFQERHVLVEDCSSTSRCDFIFPAIVKRGDVVCGISSSGKSPLVAQFVKSLLESSLPENISEINEHMNEIRKAVKQSISDPQKRAATMQAIFYRLLEDDNQTSDSEIDEIIGEAEL